MAERRDAGSKTKIEESLTFAERTVEDLNSQLLDLRKKLELLTGRVATLERQARDSAPASGPAPDKPRR